VGEASILDGVATVDVAPLAASVLRIV
jgi:hypothetical protein